MYHLLCLGTVPRLPSGGPQRYSAPERIAKLALKMSLRALVVALSMLAQGLAAASAFAQPAFPVKISGDKRYLVDQTGAPFAIMGRTAWFVTSLASSDYRAFVDDTVARGYSALELHVVNHDPRGNHPPFDGEKSAPFLKRLDGAAWTGELTYGDISKEAPDFTTPNDAYWRSVDDLLAYCEAKGLLVFLFPAYVGYAAGDQGWMREMVANGSTRLEAYGAWIASRYRDRKNLVWMMGGDMGTAPNNFDAAQTTAEKALLAGLNSVSGQQSTLFSAEWNTESIATDQASFGSSMTLNGAFSWTGAVADHGLRAYERVPVVPAFLLEEPYDEEGADGTGVNPSATQPVRRFQWWGWLCTIGGYIAGNGYVWPFKNDTWWTFADTSWKAHLDTQGAHDLTRLNAFLQSVAWHKLVPSGLGGMRNLITDGASSPNAADYVAAAASLDGTLLIAYVPPEHSGTISVDMGAMRAPSLARWFDPTAGTYLPIGSGIVNSGVMKFSTPGNNSRGEKDWVLILEAETPVPPPANPP